MHVIAAKAVAFGEALKPAFTTYQGQVIKNCQVLAKGLLALGYDLVSGGTDNHLVLVDLTNKDVTGKDAEHALDLAASRSTRNTVPFETRSPFVTSGVRIGTAALTTRGMVEADIERIVSWIDAAISARENETELDAIRKEVETFAKGFPLFAW
jgi:glycine hydroxymethyltransferase